MDPLADRIAQLSPAQRALLRQRLLAQPGQAPPSVVASSSQQRFWFIQQLDPTSVQFNNHRAYRCKGTLDLARFRRAVSAVVERHEVLRTTFRPDPDGRALPVLEALRPVEVPLIDLGAFPPEEQETRATAVAAEEANRPIDLTKGPILRCVLLRMADDHHVLILTVHHIAFDGWSTGVFLNDLAEAYRSGGLPGPLPLQYRDFAAWERRSLAGEAAARHIAYWKERLAGLARSEFPTDRPRPPVQSYRGRRLARRYSRRLADALKEVSREHRATLFMTLLAAFQVLLHRSTGQDDVAVGSQVAGRRVETEPLIGSFVNTLVIRSDLRGDPNLAELIRRVRDDTLGALEHQDLPYEEVIRVLNPERDPSRNPLFQVAIQLRNFPNPPIEVEGLRIEPFEYDARLACYDLTLFWKDQGDGLEAVLEYCTDLFEDTSMARLLDQLQVVLYAIVADPEQPISCLPLMVGGRPGPIPLRDGDVEGRYPAGGAPGPRRGDARSRSGEGPIGPRTELERRLARIWEDLLHVRSVGITENFFDLGGHSLMAAAVVARAQRELGCEVRLGWLFENPTIEGLARCLGEEGCPAGEPFSGTILRVPREGPLPLSFAQQRLWFLDRYEPDSAVYNVPLALRLAGELDVGALRGALAKIVERHEALRTVFDAQAGCPFQVVLPAREPDLPIEDLRAVGPVRHDAPWRTLAAEEARRPFDLRGGPLLRARLLCLGDREYVLLLTMHHIVSDDWSLGVLMRELATLYPAFREGRADPLPPLPIQYPDYAAWQRRMLEGRLLEEQLTYWKRQLADVPPLELPSDHVRPATQTYRGAVEVIRLDAYLAAGLRRLARENQTTLFVTLLTGFQVLLSRYTGQTDVTVGSPVAGRMHKDLEVLIGFFVNMLALRADLSGNPSFSDALGRVRRVVLEALDHQDVPFERLVETLHLPRNLGRTPLFQVMFQFLGMPLKPADLGGVWAEPELLPNGTAKFDLSVLIREGGGHAEASGLYGTITYNADLFEAATIRRLAGHFVTLLRAIVADPGQPIEGLPLLTESERAQILVDFNRTDRPYPREATLHQLFEEQVRRAPEALALIEGDVRLTYRQLNKRADQLAHQLRERCVGDGSPVALCLDRSIDFVVAVLGVLKAGGAYLPLDPADPPRRQRFLCEDAGAVLLLAHRALCPPEVAGDIPLLQLEEVVDDSPEARPPLDPPPTGHAGQLAYVMYTSGSTGRPKGVRVPHRAVVRLVCGPDYVPFGPDLRFCLLAPTCFDASTFELWAPLLHGGVCTIFPHRGTDFTRLEATLKEHEVRCLWLTAALYNVLIDERPGILEGVSHLLIGGEALSVPHVRRGLRLLPHTRIVNGYGPTEGTTFSCTYVIPRDLPDSARSVPIGRPLANTRTYILDEALRPLPVGVPGELYIGGDGLAMGYLNRLELTAERFVPDPFADDPGARLYRTGDRCRWRDDGNIEFLGRLDHQMKVRGFRIEPEEIEAALAEHPAVRQCVVTARGEGADRRLVAHFTATDTTPSAGELRQHVAERLPPHLVPQAFVVLDALPLTPTGKIDRNALAGPAGQPGPTATTDGDLTAPRNPTEKALAEIWAGVLGKDRVGIEDNFFDLGGHSLLAARLFAEIEDHFGMRLPLSALFERPTVGQLAELFQGSVRKGSYSPLVPVRPGGTRRPFFCVHGIGGEVLFLRPLAPYLPADQPIFGLQARGLDGCWDGEVTVEALAARYVEAVRSVAPHGPYCLGGFSAGGSIAFEMARLLRDQGEEIALLAVIDHRPANARGAPAGPARWLVRFLRNLPFWAFDDLLRTRPGPLIQRLIGKVQVGKKRVGEALGFSSSVGPSLNVREVFGVARLPEEHRRFLEAHYRALWAYHPRPCDVRVTLLRARTRPLFRPTPPDAGWHGLAKRGVEVHVLPGDHYSLFREPHVRALGQRLGHCLDRALAGK